MLNNKSIVKSTLGALLILTICLNYFEVYNHYWFIKLAAGYVIKIWILPVLLFCFLLFKELLAKGYSFPLKAVSGVNLFIFFYVLFGFISLTVHEQPYYIGKYGLIMFAPLTLYVVIIDFFRDSRALGNALKWLFISGVIYSLVATVYFNFVPSDEWNNDAIKVRYMLTDVTDTRALKEFKNIHGFGYGNYAVRETLPGIAEPAFGVMLAPLILIGFYYAMNSSGLLKFFYFVSSFFMFYTLTNTLARSSFVAFMIGLVLFLWLIREKKKDVLIILLAITTILLTNKPMQYRFIQLIGAVVQEAVKKPPVVQEAVKKMEKKVYFSNDGHIDSIFETYKNFKKAPFLGNGISYMESKYKDNRWYAEHNRYLYMLSTAGLLTVIPYAGFILSLILISLKTLINKLRTNKKLSDIGSGLVLCPSVLLFAIQINNAGMETYYYWIFFGLAAAWIRNSKSEDRNENSVN